MVLADLIELEFDTPAALPNLGFYKVVLHFAQIFFAFLTFCTVVHVISIERHYTGSNQAAPNYTLAVTLLSLFVAAALALFPWLRFKEHWAPVRNFFLRPRTTLIFTCFFSMVWFVAMISMTIHANDASNCTLNAKLQKGDSSYASSWMSQCNSAKATAAFCWFSFFVWILTAVCSAILLWHEKKLKHTETSAAAAAAATTASGSSSTTDNRYDEDARTIVDMEYSEKNKQPVAHCDTMSSASVSEREHQGLALQENSTVTAHPLPIPPPAPPMNSSGFTSPYVQHDNTLNTGFPYETPRTTPASATNLISPYTPPSHTSVGSPYTVPASVATPYLANTSYSSPYTAHTYHQRQPHNTNIPPEQPFVSYNSRNSSAIEQPYNNSPVAYPSGPVAYASPIVTQQQGFHQPMTSYPQQRQGYSPYSYNS